MSARTLRKTWGAAALLAFASPAWAHGADEFLIILGGLQAIVLAVVYGVFVVVRPLRKLLSGGVYGYLAGTACMWVVGKADLIGGPWALVAWFVVPVVGAVMGATLQARSAKRKVRS